MNPEFETFPTRADSYSIRTVSQLTKDLNSNWDVTRALQKSLQNKDLEIATLKKEVTRERSARSLLSWMIVSALASAILALLKSFLGVPH